MTCHLEKSYEFGDSGFIFRIAWLHACCLKAVNLSRDSELATAWEVGDFRARCLRFGVESAPDHIHSSVSQNQSWRRERKAARNKKNQTGINVFFVFSF